MPLPPRDEDPRPRRLCKCAFLRIFAMVAAATTSGCRASSRVRRGRAGGRRSGTLHHWTCSTVSRPSPRVTVATYIEKDASRRVVLSHLTYSVRFTPGAPEGGLGQCGHPVRLRPHARRRRHRHLVRPHRSTIQGAGRVGAVGGVLRGRRLPPHTGVAWLPSSLASYERDFTARDRLIATALRPHVASLVRQRTRPPPPRGAPGRGRFRRGTRPARLRHSRKRRRHRVRISAGAEAPRGLVRRRFRRSTAGAHRRLARVAVARPTPASREQRHAARRRGTDARRVDPRRGASATAADGEGGRRPARPGGGQVDRRDRARAVGHARDRQQAPRARLPQARRVEPHRGARSDWRASGCIAVGRAPVYGCSLPQTLDSASIRCLP